MVAEPEDVQTKVVDRVDSARAVPDWFGETSQTLDLARSSVEKIGRALRDGNFSHALTDLIIAANCFFLTGIELPRELFRHLQFIKSCLVPGGRLEQLYLVAERILYSGVSEGGPEIGETRRAVSTLANGAVAAPDNGSGTLSADDLREMSTGKLVNLCIAAKQRGAWQFVCDVQRIIAEREPQNPRALAFLGLTLRRLGKFKEARDYLEQSLALDPDNMKNRATLARLESDIERSTGSPEHGVDAAEYAVAPNPSGAPQDGVESPRSAVPVEYPIPVAVAAPSAEPPEPAATEAPFSPNPEASLQKPANLDRSRFDRYVESLVREGQNWEIDPENLNARVIPLTDREAVAQDFDGFERWLADKMIIPRDGSFAAFWKTFGVAQTNARRGKVIPQNIDLLIKRIPDKVDWDK